MKTKQNKSLIMSFVILISVIAVIAVIGYFVLQDNDIILQGEVEATEVKVSGKLAGRILELKAQEGDKVSKGQLLVMIDSPEIEAKKMQANSVAQAALALKNKADKGTRSETVDSAKEQLQQAKAAAEYATKSYNRFKTLYQRGVIAEQKFDEIEAKYKAALAQEKMAQSQYQMALNGAQREDRLAAKASLNQAKGAVMEVNSYINETQLYSPINGEVSEIFPKVGELVATGSPIMNIVDLSDIWITFNIREDLLSKIKMGDILYAKVPALNNKEVKIKIYYIKVLGSYATWKATKITDEYDTKTFEVKARFVDKNLNLRPGMSVIVNWSKLK